MTVKKQIMALLIILISACSSTPSHLIVSPEITSTPMLHYDNKLAQLNTVDMRTANHIVQILEEGEAAILMSAKIRLEETIKQLLTQQWQKQGLTFSQTANNKIDIIVEKAVISVDQRSMNYESQSEIILKVKVDNGEQTLTSTFKNRGNTKGPLQADIAVLEQNFNQRLTKLLTQILSNKQIHNFIK